MQEADLTAHSDSEHIINNKKAEEIIGGVINSFDSEAFGKSKEFAEDVTTAMKGALAHTVLDINSVDGDEKTEALAFIMVHPDVVNGTAQGERYVMEYSKLGTEQSVSFYLPEKRQYHIELRQTTTGREIHFVYYDEQGNGYDGKLEVSDRINFQLVDEPEVPVVNEEAEDNIEDIDGLTEYMEPQYRVEQIRPVRNKMISLEDMRKSQEWGPIINPSYYLAQQGQAE
jgi:hypothetical protein